MLRSLLLITLLFFSGASNVLAKKTINYSQLKKNTWHEVVTPNFNIVTNEKPEKVKALAIELEELRFFVSKYLGFEQFEGLPPLQFLILKDAKSFKYMRLANNIAGIYTTRPSGFFSIAEGKGLRLDSKKPTWGRHVILHEIVHHFEINQVQKLNNPYWYREGIAEYLATMMHRDGRIVFGHTNALSNRFRDMMTKGGHLTESVDVEKLFKATKKSLIEGVKKSDRSKVTNKFYGRSFIVVHYLSSKPKKRKQLALFLRLLNQNYSVDDAFKASFDTTFDDLTKQVDEYLSGQKLMARAFSSEKFNFPTFSPAVKPLDAADALYRVTDIRLRFGSGSSGKKFSPVDSIAEYDKTFDQPYKTALLLSRFDNDLTPQKIRDLLQPLIDNKAHLSDAYYLYGESIAQEATLMRETGDVNWLNKNKQSRSYYRKAIGANQFNGDAIYNLAKSYLYTPFDDKNLSEGATSFEIMSVLYEHPKVIKHEALYRVALGEYERAHSLLSRFVSINDSDWAGAQGTWLRDALALTLINRLNIETQTENTITYQDGSIYKGDIADGKPNGKGVYKASNGATYDGQFNSGLPDKLGELTASNGMIYTGDFNQGVISGKGKLVNKVSKKRPQVYVGEFDRFHLHGQGVMKYRHYSYDGIWYKGFKHGNSTVTPKKSNHSKKVKWVFDKPELILPDQTRFISEDINYATLTPKYPAKGLCKKQGESQFSECEITK